MIGNRDDDSPKPKQKDCTDKIMNIEGINIHQSTEVMVSTRTNIKSTCNICGRVFKTELEIKDHMAGFHKDDNEETSCSECTFEVKTP